MKKILVGFFAMLFCASMAWADPIINLPGGWTYTDADTILGYEEFTPADPTNEADFINRVLTLYNNAGSSFELVNYPTDFIFKFDGLTGLEIILNPGFTWTYAVVKVDGPNDFSYLFWDTQLIPGGDNILQTPTAGTYPFNMSINGYDISHISFFKGGVPVPEPGMVILLGIGLIGLAFFSRKRLLN
jgi:hypothetical protein